MANKDDFRIVAKGVKVELDSYRMAFKTFLLQDITKRLQLTAGSGAQIKGADTFEKLEMAFLQEGLLLFPAPAEAEEEDGYIRVIRSGSVLASILNSLRFPGEGSDDELAIMLGKIKRTADFQ